MYQDVDRQPPSHKIRNEIFESDQQLLSAHPKDHRNSFNIESVLNLQHLTESEEEDQSDEGGGRGSGTYQVFQYAPFLPELRHSLKRKKFS